ncbi:hypothetical protein BKA65DRAFT_545828 [Rhexocercosporidium sp. MPI-PUGE-AT-0058]|nr:hypothetical protein BKA65DRAFT_545828 [Rhexocercosporidium sp. MPI-PUGE-AT-0058]
MSSTKDAIPSSALKLIPDFGNDMITLQVGPARKEFTIHETLACTSVDYPKSAFESGFAEAQRSVMVFADKICLVTLQDTVMDRIQDICSKYMLQDTHITPYLWAKILDGRPVFRRLKRFCLDLTVYCYKQRATYTPQTYTRRIYGAEEEEEEEEEEESGGYPLYLNETDIHAAWQYAKSDVHFFRVFVDQVVQKATGLKNPRTCYKYCERGRCAYHIHAKVNPCGQVEDEKPFEFIGDTT